MQVEELATCRGNTKQRGSQVQKRRGGGIFLHFSPPCFAEVNARAGCIASTLTASSVYPPTLLLISLSVFRILMSVGPVASLPQTTKSLLQEEKGVAGPGSSLFESLASPELKTDALLELDRDCVAAAVQVEDNYYRFFSLRFRSLQLQACYEAHKQALNKDLFLFRVGFLALFCGPLWLFQVPIPLHGPSLYKASFWTWLLLFELALLSSMLVFLLHKRHPTMANLKLDSCSFWLEQLGLIGGALTAALLLLAHGTGAAALTPCPFPLQGPISVFHFFPKPCNPGAVSGLIPLLEVVVMMILPLFYSAITSVARPVLLLLLLIAYGTVGASVVSMTVQTGLQTENIVFYVFSLTFLLPILSFEAKLAANFLHVLAKTRAVLGLYNHSLSLKQGAKYDQACQQAEREQQWQEAVQRAYQLIVEEAFKNKLPRSRAGSIHAGSVTFTSANEFSNVSANELVRQDADTGTSTGRRPSIGRRPSMARRAKSSPSSPKSSPSSPKSTPSSARRTPSGFQKTLGRVNQLTLSQLNQCQQQEREQQDSTGQEAQGDTVKSVTLSHYTEYRAHRDEVQRAERASGSRIIRSAASSASSSSTQDSSLHGVLVFANSEALKEDGNMSSDNDSPEYSTTPHVSLHITPRATLSERVERVEHVALYLNQNLNQNLSSHVQHMLQPTHSPNNLSAHVTPCGSPKLSSRCISEQVAFHITPCSSAKTLASLPSPEHVALHLDRTDSPRSINLRRIKDSPCSRSMRRSERRSRPKALSSPRHTTDRKDVNTPRLHRRSGSTEHGQGGDLGEEKRNNGVVLTVVSEKPVDTCAQECVVEIVEAPQQVHVKSPRSPRSVFIPTVLEQSHELLPLFEVPRPSDKLRQQRETIHLLPSPLIKPLHGDDSFEDNLPKVELPGSSDEPLLGQSVPSLLAETLLGQSCEDVLGSKPSQPSVETVEEEEEDRRKWSSSKISNHSEELKEEQKIYGRLPGAKYAVATVTGVDTPGHSHHSRRSPLCCCSMLNFGGQPGHSNPCVMCCCCETRVAKRAAPTPFAAAASEIASPG
eukprot:g80761.t1